MCVREGLLAYVRRTARLDTRAGYVNFISKSNSIVKMGEKRRSARRIWILCLCGAVPTTHSILPSAWPGLPSSHSRQHNNNNINNTNTHLRRWIVFFFLIYIFILLFNRCDVSKKKRKKSGQIWGIAHNYYYNLKKLRSLMLIFQLELEVYIK